MDPPQIQPASVGLYIHVYGSLEVSLMVVVLNCGLTLKAQDPTSISFS